MTPPFQLFLHSKRARNFSGFHPWILEKSLVEPTEALEAGRIVDVMTPVGGWVGRGIYNPTSRIRVRLLSWDRGRELNADWVLERLVHAIDMRRFWSERQGTLSAQRLVNSEGDGLTGLIVDQFGGHLVVQVTSMAMNMWLQPIIDELIKQFSPQSLTVRIDEKTAKNEGLEVRDDVVYGTLPSEPIVIDEHGVKLLLDLANAQKTGYFLDQRQNRLRAAKWTGPGAFLDVCCYLGGFSLAAAKHAQPSSITAVDSSLRALEQAERNAEANGCTDIDFVQADCFDFMEHLVKEEKRFQTIVVDPPRMAGNRNQLPAALRAYHRLNLAAVRLLEPGGILITCSCSGRVTRYDFAGMLASVSKRSHRSLQILEQHGADFDHPVDVNCPETDYLKCYICRVH